MYFINKRGKHMENLIVSKVKLKKKQFFFLIKTVFSTFD